MQILWQTLDFAAKGLVVFAVIAASAVLIAMLTRRRRAAPPHLEVRQLNRRYQALGDGLRAATMNRKAFKVLLKQRAAEEKQPPAAQPKVYLLEFEGDLLATQVERLREEVTALTQVAGEGDEVVVKVESSGGGVPHYGLAAAQLQRLKDRKVKVTACNDRVAASGGYLMACVADQVVAAPFSVIGSIGVVAQVPNLHRLLKKHDIDFEEATAGEFKRTVSLLGEITPKGRAKLQEQLEETHHLFKEFVKAHRPQLELDQVATGEFWLGTRAKALGLVDVLGTSDEYLLARAKDAQLLKVHYRSDHPWRDRLGRLAANALLGLLVPQQERW